MSRIDIVLMSLTILMLFNIIAGFVVMKFYKTFGMCMVMIGMMIILMLFATFVCK